MIYFVRVVSVLASCCLLPQVCESFTSSRSSGFAPTISHRTTNTNTVASLVSVSSSSSSATNNADADVQDDERTSTTTNPSPLLLLNRRSTLFSIGTAATATFLGTPIEAAFAAAEPSSPAVAQKGLLESRVTDNLLTSPPYGLEKSDIFYPSYFAGVWNAESVATDVYAPCGISFFGGNSTYLNAKAEIGPEKALKYKARFVGPNDAVIADREFNVKEIAKAAMGFNAVVDVSMVTPNKFSCLLAPAGANKLFKVDMIALARRYDEPSVTPQRFDCSEVVRQIIVPADNAGRQPSSVPSSGGANPNLKEIETISLYTAVPGPDGAISTIQCRTRSATFLLPSQTEPVAYKMWEMTRGRPIDVRFYDVTYTKNA